jgi:hypothetical protein
MIQAADRIAVTIGCDAIAPLLREERPLVRGELATPALQVERHQMIIEPIHCGRCRGRMRWATEAR